MGGGGATIYVVGEDAETAMQARGESPGPTPGTALGTAWRECGRGRRNSGCSGEMRRYQGEHRRRRRPAGPRLTLRLESVGSEQD